MGVTQATKPYIKVAVQGDIITGKHRYLYLQWYNKAGGAGEDLLVVDADGDTVWQEVTDGENYSKDHLLKCEITDLTVSVLDSGTLYAFLVPHALRKERY